MEPILFRLGSYTFHAWGTVTLLGILAAAPGIWWDAGRRNMGGRHARFQFVADFYLVGIAGGIVGGRLLHVLTNLGQFRDDPAAIFAIESTGYAFYGALGVVIVGLWWLARKYGIPTGAVSDLFMTWLPLGHAFGRVGCYLAGCCHGAPTDAWIGVSFPPEAVAYQSPDVPHLEGDTGTVPLHPTQLYESIGLAGLFVWMLGMRLRHGIEIPWRQTARYAIGYAAVRFVVELFRGDPERRHLFEIPAGSVGPWLGLPSDQPLVLSTSQAVAVVACVVGLWGLRHLRGPGRGPGPDPHPGPNSGHIPGGPIARGDTGGGRAAADRTAATS